jgi:hypothetical protein
MKKKKERKSIFRRIGDELKENIIIEIIGEIIMFIPRLLIRLVKDIW